MTFLQKFINTSDYSLGLLRKGKTCQQSRCKHSWASASRPMPSASTYRHPASQWARLGPFIPVQDWFRNIHYFLFWYRANQMLDSSSSASIRTVERRNYICKHVPCTSALLAAERVHPACKSLFLGPKWQSPIGSMPFHGAENSRISGPNPLPLANVMDIHASKTSCTSQVHK